jgi:hypothetical protein
MLWRPRIDAIRIAYHTRYIDLIKVHNDATNDLKSIKNINKDLFSRILMLIQQLKNDEKLIKILLDHKSGKEEKISVQELVRVKRQENLIIRRLKFNELEKDGIKYRIIYYFDWKLNDYYIMAIINRNDLDYDNPNDTTICRVINTIKREFPGQ